MSAVTRFFGACSCLNPRKASRLARNTTADRAKHLREPPVVLAEIIVASSILDFGGMPDARYFDTLYDWRHSEAGKGSQIAPSKKGTPLSWTLPPVTRKGIFEGSPVGKNGHFAIGSPSARCFLNLRDDSYRLRAHTSGAIVDQNDGIYNASTS